MIINHFVTLPWVPFNKGVLRTATGGVRMRTRCSRCRAGVALSLSLQHAALALRRSQVSLSWRMRSWALTQGGNPQRRAFVFPPGGRLEMPITVTELGWDGSGLMGQPLPVKWGRHHFIWRAGWQTAHPLNGAYCSCFWLSPAAISVLILETTSQNRRLVQAWQ